MIIVKDDRKDYWLCFHLLENFIKTYSFTLVFFFMKKY